MLTPSETNHRVAHYDADAEEAALLGAKISPDIRGRFIPLPLNEETVAEASDVQEVEAVTVFVRSQVTRDILERLPKLRLIATRSTGFDHIDLTTCREKGVTVCNVPTYGENTVAEHTFGLILALSRNIHKAWERTRHGNFSLRGLRGFDLQGKTLGVIGTGHIGLHAARIGRGFGMQVLAHDPFPNAFLSDLVGFRYVSLEALLADSDIVSLHAPLTPSTHHLIDRKRMAAMKRGALLINTARGGLVDTAALHDALEDGQIGGAALDVFEGEALVIEDAALSDPSLSEEDRALLRQNHEILRRENVVMTPHIGFYSVEAEDRIRETTAANLLHFFRGEPINVVPA
ncbi:MAG: hydroxyacid dehydrogenase [Armatimonadetes bacterium]|nr:hydroxyacid dehydrogenase [Armatimonadota bacterium]